MPHTQFPHPLERRFLAFSLVYIPLLCWCEAILPIVQDPLWTPAVSHPPDLVGLSVSCSGFLGHWIIWFFPSPPYCKSIHILPGPPAPALAWHLLLDSRYCCLSLRLLPKGDLKKSRLLFSAENFHWYLIAPEMSLKFLTVHMSHPKARPLPQHIPSPCSGPWPLCWFTRTVQSDTVTVLLWSGLVYDVIEWWPKYEISRAAPV